MLKNLLPTALLEIVRPPYHLFLAWLGAFAYGNPSERMLVIGVTGTKGKTSVTEMLDAIFEAAGYKTALINSIRFKSGAASERNLTRMSMPGRFFIQKFLRHAQEKGCNVAILEMTSEGARQSRHRFIAMNALVFTNLAPEHIESHGSLQAYADAKFELGKELVRSKKRPRVMVANAEDKESTRYLTLAVESALPFSLASNAPYEAGVHGGYFTFEGQRIDIRLSGEFSLKNALAAATTSSALGVRTETIAAALGALEKIPGRAERVEEGQNFSVVVDYAHTPDSLFALYSAYKDSRKICVLGATGGGRDTWKRPVMGRIASDSCERVILTNEDPYDEDPAAIIQDVAHGMSKKPEIILDRREAIRRALEYGREASRDAKSVDEVAVLISGKGTDPSIAGARGTRVQWSDKDVVRDELERLVKAV